MEFTNDEIVSMSGFFNKMVLPVALMDVAERMKDYVTSLEPVPAVEEAPAEVAPDAPVEEQPAPEAMPEVAVEAPVEAPIEAGDVITLDANDIEANPVLADHGFVAGEEVVISEVIPG